MTITTQNTTIICPKNDGESYTIVNIALSQGFDVRISSQRTWFCPLDKESDVTFENLKKHVVIIEMPSPKREKELEQKGHTVHVIDHHDYPSFHINRENKKSSLEQFADMIGYQLNRKEKGIAINDQLYIYGLFQHNYSVEEINEIRRFDLQCQGYTKEQLDQSIEDVNTKEKIAPNTFAYTSRIQKFTYLCDLHVMQHHGVFSNILISGNTLDERGEYMFFSGAMGIIDQLKTLGGYSKKSNDEYGLWGGYQYGVEKVPFAKALSVIKGNVLS